MLPKLMNDVSLVIMTLGFLINGVLILQRNRTKKFIGFNWLAFSVGYLILIIRLFLTIDYKDAHIALYKGLLILNLVSIVLIAIHYSTLLEPSRPRLAKGLQSYAAIQFIVVFLVLLFDDGFDVHDTPLYVEIMPSFTCQTLMSIGIIILAIMSFVLMKFVSEKEDPLYLGIFLVLFMIHIPLPVIVGYDFWGSFVIFLLRIVMVLVISVHTAKIIGPSE